MSANNTPATFTDDDLVKLKNLCRIYGPDRAKTMSLVARLEAAERAMLACQEDFCCNTKEYAVWCKVAGKSE